jgi:hypothetical protein
METKENRSFEVTPRELAVFTVATVIVGGGVWALLPFLVNLALAPTGMKLPVPVGHAVGFLAFGVLTFPVWQVWYRSRAEVHRWSFWRYAMVLVGVAVLSMSIEGLIRSGP